MTPTTFQDLIGIFLVALGLLGLVISALMKRGKLKPNAFWGRNEAEVFWQGIGILAWGLGMISHLVASESLASWLYILGALVFMAAIYIGRKKAAAKI